MVVVIVNQRLIRAASCTKATVNSKYDYQSRSTALARTIFTLPGFGASFDLVSQECEFDQSLHKMFRRRRKAVHIYKESGCFEKSKN